MIKVAGIFLFLAVAGSINYRELPLYSVRSAEGTGAGICPATPELRKIIEQDVKLLINNSVLPTLLTKNQTQAGNTGLSACGCGGPGWRRVIYLNMSDTTQSCPLGWSLITSPRRSCGRPSNAGGRTCYSATFPIHGIQYSQVCGRIIGYQKGEPQTFVYEDRNLPQTIDGPYVDGVSLTYGNPRQHIWTFAAALDERGSNVMTNLDSICPCTNISNPFTVNIPSYVGDNYFCETGVPTGQTFSNIYYADDPLWDGQGCGPASTCCTFNNPPWFCKQLSESTNADLEMRLCGIDTSTYENTPVELVEIFAM